MKPLDDLLAISRPVPDISPDGLSSGRGALNAALSAGHAASAARGGRDPGSWLSGLRAKALIGTAAVAAGAAAAATVIVMPSSSPAGLAGSSARPAVTAPKAPVARAMPSAPTTLTAATVLGQAARAAGSQPGWPNARYWYSEDKYTCGGQLYTDKIWIYRYGKGVVEKTGPRNGGSSCTGDLGMAPLFPAYVFGPYTWSQLYALPTDPARLEPKLMADSHNIIYQHPGTAAQWASQQASFQYVMTQLTDTPAPPALREALFKVAASIHGVRVRGHYTDSLGRTGTALQLGRYTMVVDPANGLILDENPDTGPSTIMFITQGPATSEPKLAR
jgi:hypothetical protein